MKTLKQIFTGFGQKDEVQETVSSRTTEHIHKHENHETHSGTETLYQCPMKCEGDKTYEEPGLCPVCNMKLVQLSPNKSNYHDYGYDGHSYHKCC